MRKDRAAGKIFGRRNPSARVAGHQTRKACDVLSARSACRGFMAAQMLEHQVGRLRAHTFEGVHVAADDAATEIGAVGRVDRSVGRA